MFFSPKRNTFFYILFFFILLTSCSFESWKASLTINLPNSKISREADNTDSDKNYFYKVSLYTQKEDKVELYKEKTTLEGSIVFENLHEGTYLLKGEAYSDESMELLLYAGDESVEIKNGEDTSVQLLLKYVGPKGGVQNDDISSTFTLKDSEVMYSYMFNNLPYILLNDDTPLSSLCDEYDVYYGDFANPVNAECRDITGIAVYEKYAGYVPIKITKKDDVDTVFGEFTVFVDFSEIICKYDDTIIDELSIEYDETIFSTIIFELLLNNVDYCGEYDEVNGFPCNRITLDSVPLEMYYKETGDKITDFDFTNENYSTWSIVDQYYTELSGCGNIKGYKLNFSESVGEGNLADLDSSLPLTIYYYYSYPDFDINMESFFTCGE